MNWLTLATEPVPFLLCLACLAIAAVAALLLGIEQAHRQATEALADAAKEHAEAACEHAAQLQRALDLERDLTGLRTQLVLILGAQSRQPSGPRCN